MKILGLDISTSNVGVCVVDTEGPQNEFVCLAIGIPISSKKGLYVKSCVIQNVLREISERHKIDVIAVEESLQAFRRNMSSAKTISTLNRFNGMISFIARDLFDCPLVLGNVISVRNKIGLKINKKSSQNTKEQVFEWVRSHEAMRSFDWPTKILKSGPNKGMIRFESYCYDISDAFVMALWGSKYLKKEDLDPTIS